MRVKQVKKKGETMWELINQKLVRRMELSLYCDGERFVAILGSDLCWVEDEQNWLFETESAIEAFEWFREF